jgi:High potential iron-sulfur protein
MPETCNPSGIRRRTVLLAASAAPLLALTGGQAQAKIAPAGVHYQATPKDGKQCDGCNFFVAPNSCKLVDGEIAPTGWCALWAKKAAP